MCGMMRVFKWHPVTHGSPFAATDAVDYLKVVLGKVGT